MNKEVPAENTPQKSTENQAPKSPAALAEEKTLEFWRQNKIFEKTLEKTRGGKEFVFYEGPPTANAAPALHHLEARAFKDIIPRYKTMQGFHVARKAGWDTHGLPVEIQVEKKLGLKSKKEIETYGIEAFNRVCKESVWEYVGAWNTFTDRIGYWLDRKNPYITYDKTYMESVWNILKTVSEHKAHGESLMYKDYRVVPWCTRCGTALSSHELAQGYEEVKDLAVYVKFKVKNQENTYFLAWTTTPWTLPGNVALAIGNDIDYVKIRPDPASADLTISNEVLILAESRLSVIATKYIVVEKMKGRELVSMNLEYEPLYPFLQEKFAAKNPEAFKKAYKVYPADFVTTTDGTGIVHTAVMYGQDDFVLGTKIGLPKFHLVNEDGHFMDGMSFFSGRYVKEKNEAGKPTLDVDIIDDLKKRGLFFNQENHKHSYPHCWRCKTPLIYYARDSWYIRMSELRDKLVAENEKINWEPEHIQEGRFGEWLREVKDWAISRERYWGTPLPIWENAKGERVIIGSVAELKERIPKKNNYFLMRHGQSESNANAHGAMISSTLGPGDALTEKGRNQAAKAVKKLARAKIDVIITSPFTRAKQTAEIIKNESGFVGEIFEDARIGEIQTGNWDGKLWKELEAELHGDKDRFDENILKSRNLKENWESVRARVAAFMYEIDEKYAGKNILIVSHGGPLDLVTLASQGFSVQEMAVHYHDVAFENAEVREIDWRNLPHDPKFEIDLHRPFIDAVTLFDEKGNKLTRIKEVLDVWFDSGAMPFAQYHYPFEGGAGNVAQKVLGKSGQKIPYPADYISEAIDQTRGWFYTLHAIGILMGKGQAYKNVVCLGHILDADGKKMSKSVGNIVDPWKMMDKYGVDALRMWMYTVNQPGDSKNFDERSVDDIVKKVFNLAGNIVSFYELYADQNVDADDGSKHVLDRWIIERFNQLVSEGTEALDNFKIFEASRAIRDFVADFSTWYIRRSRDRFKSDDVEDRKAALATTRFVLQEFSKYLAPFAPFFAEQMYSKVKWVGQLEDSSPSSVHLENWPKVKKPDTKILEEMAEVRRLVSLALEARAKAGVRVRQVLSKLTLQSTKIMSADKKELLDLIADEVNVKEVILIAAEKSAEKSEKEVELDTQITPALLEEGNLRELIRFVQDARKKAGLDARDKASLVVSTDSAGENFMKKFSAEISKVAALSVISFENLTGEPVEAGGMKFILAVKK